MKKNLIKNLLILSLVSISTASIQAQEKLEEKEVLVKEVMKEPTQKVKPTVPDSNQIYGIVAVPATYPEGDSALLEDMAENFEYPEEAREKKVESRLILSFVVEKDGSISNIEVTRGLGAGLDEAAIAAAKKLKTFTPAYHNDKPVRSYFSLPFRCSVE